VTERFVVQVDADRFDSLARPTLPVAGAAELIWNALDADAETVTVQIGRTELDGVDTVSVTDDGHGMTNAEAVRTFKRWGGSWKKTRATTKGGKRSLHGKSGEGRFRAFAIGSTVEWTSVADRGDGKLERTRATGSIDTSEFVVGDPEELVTGATGTTVRITRPREYANRLLGDGADIWLVTRFAVYLVKYPNIRVTYDGQVLDPATIVARQTESELDRALGGEHGPPLLRIIEWKHEAKAISPSLVLCDENGVALHEVTDRIDSPPGIHYTAYLMWGGFPQYAHDLLLADLGHETLTPIVEAAREAIRSHLDTRLSEQRDEVIERWKTEHVYPTRERPRRRRRRRSGGCSTSSRRRRPRQWPRSRRRRGSRSGSSKRRSGNRPAPCTGC